MKRPLFVFAGQSNMMGAAVNPAKEQVYYNDSYEYLHKPRRFGESIGKFKKEGFPVGEFSYKNLDEAYEKGASSETKSTLVDYMKNSFFCPAMNELKNDETKERYKLEEFSEDRFPPMCASMAPYIVKGLEDNGYVCAYTHIAKGGMDIKYFIEGDAADYFYRKSADFFADSEKRFATDDTSEKILVWHQGESDVNNGCDYYVEALGKLWEKAKNIGFTKLLIIRVGYWAVDEITEIMRAQEIFCRKTEDAYIVTRAASFIEWCPSVSRRMMDWEVPDEFNEKCRDAYLGYWNGHLNEKGFRTIAKYAVPNIIRIVYEGKDAVLEEEQVNALK